MLGQPLVQERVIGVQQVDHAAILADDALEEQLRLPLEGLAQVVVEVEQHFRTRLMHGHIADEQPLAGEVLDERLRARVREHPPHLLLQDVGLAAEFFFSATSRSSSSGMLLHRKNDSRDAKSRSLMRYGALAAAAAG